MEFSQVLELFDIERVYAVDNYIRGQQGLIFQLKNSIAYLYEETRGNGRNELFVERHKISLSQAEMDKVHTLLRLHRVQPKKMHLRDFWIYSQKVKEHMLEVIDKHPRLEKGSTHLAFAPKNYTRFSENLLFDFDYLYNTDKIISELQNFEVTYKELQSKNPKEFYADQFTDDMIYRYLLANIRTNRISINGQFSLPDFLMQLFESIRHDRRDDIVLHTGPFLIQLRKGAIQMDFHSIADRSVDHILSQEKSILRFEFSDLIDLLDVSVSDL